MSSDATEGGVDASVFRPSDDQYGRTAGRTIHCLTCGHASLTETPPSAEISRAYAQASDPVSLREEEGQVETSRRALQVIERFATPGVLCDFGCWTGSSLVAARERGWTAFGIEPSIWASDRARARGLDVVTAELQRVDVPAESVRAVVMCDVLEHLIDPAAALATAWRILEPDGVLYITVPDAGSPLARALGPRWWAVVPMHVQYFTRTSLRHLLSLHGFVERQATTHPKLFSASYYAERLAGYWPRLSRLSVAVLARLGVEDRLIAPNFRDRMAVWATKPAMVGARLSELHSAV